MNQTLIGAAALVLAFSVQRGSAQNFISGNLLTNPGAEAGDLTGWTIGAGVGFTQPSTDNGVYDTGINPHSGSWDFVGDRVPGGGAQGYLYQSVAVSAYAATIDTGNAQAQVNFWEQSLSQGGALSDTARITLSFYDAGSSPLGSVTTPTAQSLGVWQNYTGAYAVPVGTRSITYTMGFYRGNNGGTYIDSFIDDNSLRLSAPEPVSTTTFAAALLAGAALWRRRAKAA